MKKFYPIICFCIFILIFGCTKKSADGSADDFNSPFGKIGKKVYSIGDLTAFNSMLYHHPVRGMQGRFPGSRNTTALFVETQVLYPEAAAHKKIGYERNGMEVERDLYPRTDLSGRRNRQKYGRDRRGNLRIL